MDTGDQSWSFGRETLMETTPLWSPMVEVLWIGPISLRMKNLQTREEFIVQQCMHIQPVLSCLAFIENIAVKCATKGVKWESLGDGSLEGSTA